MLTLFTAAMVMVGAHNTPTFETERLSSSHEFHSETFQAQLSSDELEAIRIGYGRVPDNCEIVYNPRNPSQCLFVYCDVPGQGRPDYFMCEDFGL